MQTMVWGMLLVCGFASSVLAAPPSWIWSQKTTDGQHIWMRTSFEVTGEIKSAKVTATCDNHFILYLNGQRVLAGDEWAQLPVADVAKHLKQGKNTIAVEAWNDGGIAAFISQLSISRAEKTQDVISDSSWKVSTEKVEGWRKKLRCFVLQRPALEVLQIENLFFDNLLCAQLMNNLY